MAALRPAADLSQVKTVSAALALCRRGLSLLKAKRCMEEMLERGRTVVLLPSLDDAEALSRDLAESGVIAAMVASPEIDARSVRERLGLTQEQFALRFGLDLSSVQNWETGRRKPDRAARSYLKVIERMPDAASAALEVPPSRQ